MGQGSSDITSSRRRSYLLLIGGRASSSASADPAWSQQVAPHQTGVLQSRESRIGLLAVSIVPGIGVFPKLLDDLAVDPGRLERRQHRLDEGDGLGVVDERPLVLPSE